MKKIITTLTATICLFLSKNISAQGFSWTASGNTVSLNGYGACGGGVSRDVTIYFEDSYGSTYTSVVLAVPIASNLSFTISSAPVPNSVGCNGVIKKVVWTCPSGTSTSNGSTNSGLDKIRPFKFTNNSEYNSCSGTAVNAPLTTNVPATIIQWRAATNNTNVTGESFSWKAVNTINDVLVNNTSATQSVTYNMSATTNHYGFSCDNGNNETIKINVHPSNPTLPTVSVYSGDTAICASSSVKLQYSVVTNAGYNTPITWSNSAATQNPLTVTQTGSYSVSATNACGTFTSNVINVVPMNLQVNTTTSNSSILCGQTTTLTANASGASNISYYWSPNDGSLTGATTAIPTAKPKSTTKYTVTATAPNGCTAKDTVTITVNLAHQVNVSATKTAITCGDSTQLQASVTGNVSNIGYYWGFYSSPITGANTNTLIATPKNTVTYYGSAYTPDGCVAVDSITITVNPYQVNASATKTEISCGGSTQLHATETNGATYAWSPNNTLTGANTANPTAKPTSTTTYTVSSSLAGCGTATDNITITVGAYTPQIFTHTTNELTATFTNKEENAVSYAWDFGDGNASTSENPTHTYDADGTYNVCLFITNSCGEEEQVCANVTVNKGVGVQNIEQQTVWNVYPNPTNNAFTVSNAPIGASLSATDLTGKIVYTNRISAEQTTVETTTFTSGIYFVNITSEGITTTRKVVVAK